MEEEVVEAPVARHRGRPALNRDTPLDRGEIVAHALEIVRRDGVDALTMRRLSAELRVSPMAIYHHLPDKPALLLACVDQIWDTIMRDMVGETDDLVELIVLSAIRVRRAWIDHIDLAALAVTVAPADEGVLRESIAAAMLFAAAGFPDVPLAFNAIQTFTTGSIQIAANRRASSRYFSRDPDEVLATSRETLAERGTPIDIVGVLEARFDEGDERHFESGLRILVAGLLAGGTTATR